MELGVNSNVFDFRFCKNDKKFVSGILNYKFELPILFWESHKKRKFIYEILKINSNKIRKALLWLIEWKNFFIRSKFFKPFAYVKRMTGGTVGNYFFSSVHNIYMVNNKNSSVIIIIGTNQ